MEFSLIDTLWVFLAAILVFFMNLGFASVEAGFARSKNTVNILSKNFIVFAVSSLGFLLLGWGLMFGGDNPVVGTQHLFILGNQDLSFYNETLTSTVPFWGKFFFQLVFCGTAATIVSGAVAERVKYVSFIIFSFVLTLVIYPVVGHWIWGGGWLADLGFKDFAGDAAVHSVGGWAALAGAMLLGPRIGKYGRDGKPRAIPGHSMSLAVIGLFVLWLGWFGFNPGSTMSFQNPSDVFHILMTTNTSAIAAVLTSTITSWIVMKKPDLGMTVNGCLAGLVAVTGGCAYFSIEISLLVGALSGILVVLAVSFFDRLKIDDPVGATAVHLCCGVFGTICVGLFAQSGVTSLSTVDGLFFGGGFGLLGIQSAGCRGSRCIHLCFFFDRLVCSKKDDGHSCLSGRRNPRIGYRRTRKRGLSGFRACVRYHTRYDRRYKRGNNRACTNTGRVNGTNASVGTGRAQRDTRCKTDQGNHCCQPKQIFTELQKALDHLGITGITVTNVFGYGIQKGHPLYFRGAPVSSRLLPKVKIDIVVCEVPVDVLVQTVQNTLYTGNIGDGKIFIYDVEDVIKIRTGEHGRDALQDAE